jgi:uncharacterized UBP type Zn finger protein
MPLRGLVNLGNTCYFNAAVQALFHVPALTRRLFQQPYTGDCEVTREYGALVCALLQPASPEEAGEPLDDVLVDAVNAGALAAAARHARAAPVDPSPLLRAFRARFPRFVKGRQHDAAEVVALLVDVFEESLGKEFMDQHFGGETSQSVTFLNPSPTADSPFCVSTVVTPFLGPHHLTVPVRRARRVRGAALTRVAERRP